VAARQEIEQALAAWRDAEKRRADADGHYTPEMDREIEETRRVYQRVAADHMAERLDALRDAESRRASATPSTDDYHDAAGEERAIAAEAGDDVKHLDNDTPGAP
jgi:hypothetical protein